MNIGAKYEINVMKKWLIFAILKAKKVTSHAVPGYFGVFLFLNCVLFVPLKSVWGHFGAIDKHVSKNSYHSTPNRDFKLNFLGLVTSDDLDLT